MYLLEMQSEKTFGKFDHLRNQIITLSHAQAIAALVENTGQATAYFSSPPFTQIALRATNVHVMASSTDIMNGKSSFLILGARRSYVDLQSQVRKWSPKRSTKQRASFVMIQNARRKSI